MAKIRYLPGEKAKSFKSPMKCEPLKEKKGKSWVIYDWPVDEHDLTEKKYKRQSQMSSSRCLIFF